jgi:predicted kinase
MNKTLVMMVGFPRSGKTTIATAIAASRHAPIVNPDNIRLALHGHQYIQQAEPFVWAIAHVMVRALFHTYDTVVLDACNNTRKRRDEWKSRDWRREFQHIATGADVCRNRAGQDDGLVAAIDRMAAAFEPVTDDEN